MRVFSWVPWVVMGCLEFACVGEFDGGGASDEPMENNENNSSTDQPDASLLTCVPPATNNFRLVYDSIREEVMLFGHSTSSDLWSWNGSAWGPVCTGECATIPPRQNFPMAFDAQRDRLVVGDSSLNGPVERTSFWEFGRDIGWSQFNCVGVGAQNQPLCRVAQTMAPGPKGGLLFGGFAGSDFGLWNGTSAREACPNCTLTPNGAYGARLASAGSHTFFYGADQQTPPGRELWRFDGAQWELLCDPDAGCVSPRASVRTNFAFDSKRNVLVLHAGENSSFEVVNETWEWTDDGWTLVCGGNTDCVAPPAKSHVSMAFDAARGHTVLFLSGEKDTTWGWDGTRWTNLCAGEV